QQFFLELMKVPRAEYKLIAFSYMLRFESLVSELRQCLNICQSAIEQASYHQLIRSSAKLKRVMQTLLCLGNALNQGTARGGAVGFRLDTLLKLTDTRARNSRMTLMHYLCKVLADKLPEVLDFSKDLGSLEPASKMQLKLLGEKMQVNTRGWCRVVEEKRFAKKEGRVSKKFRKGLKEFVCSADNEVRSLVSLYTTLVQNAYALARYFDEDPAICTYEQIVLTLLEFTRMFNQAIEENTKQLESEKVVSKPQMKS
ncbi:formin-like protein 13 isoform X1, partial [Tanacetum coccineum]